MNIRYCGIGKCLRAIMLIFLLVSSSSQAATTWYVDGDILIPGDGTSWHEAFSTIPDAVSAAVSWDEIWVKKGVYSLASPISINDQDLRLYGGFRGNEISKEQRD